MLKRRPQLSGFLVGFVVTAIATFVCFRVFDAKLQIDRAMYDWRVKHFNTIEASDRIVHVDIDDSAVDEVGRWPWRRKRIAELLSVINELGAQYILVDLLISEKELPYFDDPRLYIDHDIDPDMSFVGLADPPIVAADVDLAEVVRTAGNVIMAVQLDAYPPGDRRSLRDRLRLLLRENPDITESAAMAALKLDRGSDAIPEFQREWLRHRVIVELEQTLTLDVAALAGRLDVDHRKIERLIAGAKRAAAARWVDRAFREDPNATLADIREAVFGDRVPRLNPDDQDIRKAYRAHLGTRDLDRHLIQADGVDPVHLHSAASAVPVLHPIGAAALDIAAVNFSADPDGIVRRVPPLIAYDGRVAKHLGVAAAAHILRLDFERATTPSDRRMQIPATDGSGSIDVPMDGRGNMVIPWTRTATRWRQGEDFPHISAAALIEIVDNRTAMSDNQKRLLYAWADVVAAAHPAVVSTNSRTGEQTTVYPDQAYRERIRELIAKRVRLKHAGGPESEALREEIAAIENLIGQTQAKAASTIQMFAADIEGMTDEEIGSDEATRKAVERIRRGATLLNSTIPELEAANRRIAADVDALLARLRPSIRNRYVFVGFAATAQGDIVSTPIDARTNGVMCHANVLNAFLQNRFITTAPAWMEFPACLIAGAIVGLWTSNRSPRFALTVTILLIVGIFAVGCLVIFKMYDTWYVLTPFVLALLFCWAAVTLFRQLTAERDKRMFRTQLSQYTSPAIAARIAESPEAAEAFKKVQTRDMTCYFSDLAGFTSISEREDAEVVQHVLNVYLERMSAAIWEYRGLINKFMGDGIMAIFNPSVDPLDDHPRIACETALHTLHSLDELKREMESDNGAPIFRQLEMRIGLAAGQCKNGDMGSELKADYTVIGDIVNLAARLEPANKVFGTRILISGALHDRVADDFDFRYLAELQVKGKNKTVPVYELIGRKGSMTDDERAYVERFEKGVELYKQRKWDECIVHFTRILARRPDDSGAGRYIDACQEMKAFAPPAEWAGALELKEK